MANVASMPSTVSASPIAERPRVVNQQVESVVAVLELRREVPDVVLGREVPDVQFGPPVAVPGLDFLRDVPPAFAIPADDGDRGTVIR